jgi:NUDIX domain
MLSQHVEDSGTPNSYNYLYHHRHPSLHDAIGQPWACVVTTTTIKKGRSLQTSQPPRPVSDTIIPRAAVSVAVRVQVQYKSKSSNSTFSTNTTDHLPTVDTTGRTGSSSSTATTSTTSATTTKILQQPRQQNTFYLLIQRGTEPNIGMWTLPGGKIEFGESTFHAAQRELNEETQWWSGIGIQNTTTTPTGTSSQPYIPPLRWCNQTVLTTDAIGSNYHYVIAHYFAEYPTIEVATTTTTLHQTSEQDREPLHDTTTSAPTLPVQDVSNYLPNVTASDDAKNARWFTLLQIYEMENNCQNMTTPSLYQVLRRMEVLDVYRLLVS